MSESAIQLLFIGAASIAFLHTLIGVDHYLPFILIGKSRSWSLPRTLSVTALCGIGHVAGSVLLGLVGVGLGVAVSSLEAVESTRGSLAAWAMIAFGLIYAVYSLRESSRSHTHRHVHTHADGTVHDHTHDHHDSHSHVHADELAGKGGLGMTRWGLFLVFVLGPCEALIPMFMVPAYEHNWLVVVGVAAVFGMVTIATMLAAVAAGLMGLSLVSLRPLERHANTMAGFAIAGSG